jgi:capsular polysaccharide export protein
LSEYAKRFDKKRLYFEISNIQNRIFADPWGIAGESYLFANPQILDRYEVDEEAFYRWREAYRASKKGASSRLKSSIPWQNILDHLGYGVGFLKEDYRSIWRLGMKRLQNRVTPLPLEEPDLKKSYIFTPLQVSNDSQVKLFSRYDNEQLIQKALQFAEQKDMLLYLKPHPAEDNIEEIERLRSYLNHPRVRFVGGDLFDLLINAAMVVVNNSTVGLEAKIFDKETVVLGDAYYKNFNKHRVMAYIMHYLPKAQYYPPKVVQEDLIHLERL